MNLRSDPLGSLPRVAIGIETVTAVIAGPVIWVDLMFVGRATKWASCSWPFEDEIAIRVIPIFNATYVSCYLCIY